MMSGVPFAILIAVSALCAVIARRQTSRHAAIAFLVAATGFALAAIWLWGEASWAFRDRFPALHESTGVESLRRFAKEFWFGFLLFLAELAFIANAATTRRPATPPPESRIRSGC